MIKIFKIFLLLQISIKNVSTNTLYEISVSGASKSLYSNKLIEGKLSQPKTVHVHPNCDKIQEYMRHTTSELSAGVVAGVVCAAFAFLLAITAFVLWRYVTMRHVIMYPACTFVCASLILYKIA